MRAVGAIERFQFVLLQPLLSRGCLSSYFTKVTGIFASSMIFSATDPSTSPATAPSPRVPITIWRHFSCLANSNITCAGEPTRVYRL